MNDIFHNPVVINAFSFVVFVALAWHFGRKPALKWIDGEIAKIRAELAAAHQLRAEAEAALADCKTRQASAEMEAKLILDMAKQQVEAMRVKAEADLAATLTRHEQLAADRIRLAEAQALADVRTAAIDAAMSLARQSLAKNLPAAEAAKLVDQAIAGIPALKKDKPKAA